MSEARGFFVQPKSQHPHSCMFSGHVWGPINHNHGAQLDRVLGVYHVCMVCQVREYIFYIVMARNLGTYRWLLTTPRDWRTPVVSTNIRFVLPVPTNFMIISDDYRICYLHGNRRHGITAIENWVVDYQIPRTYRRKIYCYRSGVLVYKLTPKHLYIQTDSESLESIRDKGQRPQSAYIWKYTRGSNMVTMNSSNLLASRYCVQHVAYLFAGVYFVGRVLGGPVTIEQFITIIKQSK